MESNAIIIKILLLYCVLWLLVALTHLKESISLVIRSFLRLRAPVILELRHSLGLLAFACDLNRSLLVIDKDEATIASLPQVSSLSPSYVLSNFKGSPSRSTFILAWINKVHLVVRDHAALLALFYLSWNFMVQPILAFVFRHM